MLSITALEVYALGRRVWQDLKEQRLPVALCRLTPDGKFLPDFSMLMGNAVGGVLWGPLFVHLYCFECTLFETDFTMATYDWHDNVWVF